jgi:hypothetical protein
MSKGVKKVLSVAAAIAIPYFAPYIAGSTALAGVTSAIGSTATSALVGAGLGAVKGAVLGEDIGRSALMGGIGGGINSYLGGPAYGASAGATNPVTGAATNMSVAPQSTAGSQFAQWAGTPTGTTAGLDVTGAGLSGGMSYAPQVAAGETFAQWAGMDPQMSFAPVTPTANQQFGQWTGDATAAATAAPNMSYGTAVQPAQIAGTAGAPKTFTEAIKAVPQEIAKKFSDPKNLADLTLRAAGQLAGSLFAGDGLSAEEQALLEAQTEELRQLQSTNQGLFQQKLNEAQRLIGESKYFDPEYFGLQSARRAQTQGAVAKSAGLRGLTGERRTSESRRYDLATGRATGTAFDTGFQSAIGPRLQTQQVGLSAMPGYLNYQTPATTAQLNAEELKRQRRASEVEGIQTLFGSLTETPQASSRG